MSPIYGHVTKLFFRKGIPKKKKEINKRKNANFQQNLAVFLAGTDQKIKLFKYYTGKDKKNLEKIVINRTGTYL